MKNKRIIAAVITGILAAAGSLGYIESEQITTIIQLLGLL